MNRIFPRLFATLLITAGAVLVACSTGDAAPTTPVLTPSATASPTPETDISTTTPEAPPVTVTQTPAPATPTPDPEPECPIEDAVCTLARSLLAALEQGDYEAIVDLMQPRDETCPGGTPQGAGGPFPLCEGAPQGEVRSGYQLSRRYSEGWFPGREGVVMFLESFSDAASPDVTDDYGSGEVRLQAVSCVTPAGAGCSQASVIFTAILEGNRREILVYFVPIPADPSTPILRASNGIVMLDEEASIFETGGEVFGLGRVYVLAE